VLVADVGCGHGASTILMTQEFPNPSFVGSDYHSGSIETARLRAREAGVEERVMFGAEPASAYTGTGYDLVTMFDCLQTWATLSAPPATSTRRSSPAAPG
jgi:ubiquinone/menaquinone biosynthesis C-methylase UbiE